MIRPVWIACAATVCVLLTALPAVAQEDVFIPMDGGLVTLGVGWTTAENEATSKDADGLSYEFTADWVTLRPRISIGVAIASMNQHEETGDYRNNLSTVPVYLTAKYWLGKAGGRVYGYVGVCLGGYNTTVETLGLTNDDYKRDRTSGFAMAVPVGAAVFVSKRVFFTAGYQFNWFDQSFYQDDVAHLFLFGAGLTFGIGD